MDPSAPVPAPAASTLRIRAALPVDHPAIRELLRAAYGEYAAFMPPQIFQPYMAELLDFARPRGAQLLVADDGGEVVGTATFYQDAATEGLSWPPARWAGVRAVAVAPALRSRGIARALMSYCEQGARQTGAAMLCLHTAEFMTAAVRLYEGLGYRRAPEFDFDPAAHFSVDPDQRVVAIAYCLRLR